MHKLAVEPSWNLTLIASWFNEGVWNLAWDLKSPDIGKQSKLQLNGPIAAT